MLHDLQTKDVGVTVPGDCIAFYSNVIRGCTAAACMELASKGGQANVSVSFHALFNMRFLTKDSEKIYMTSS